MIFTVVASLINGILFRRRGGGLLNIVPIPKFWCKIAFGVIISLLITQKLGLLYGFLVGMPVVIGITHGWGTLFDFGKIISDYKKEHDRPITWLIGKEKKSWSERQRYIHNTIGMYLRGLLISLYSGLVCLLVGPTSLAIGIGLSGLLFGLVYHICFHLRGNFKIPLIMETKEAYTEAGEFLFGILFTLFIGVLTHGG